MKRFSGAHAAIVIILVEQRSTIVRSARFEGQVLI